jgi:hypothetical protein
VWGGYSDGCFIVSGGAAAMTTLDAMLLDLVA